jgi:hypothetical protein
MGGIDYFWGNKMKSDENVQGVEFQDSALNRILLYVTFIKRRDINKNGYFKPQDIGVRDDVLFTWEGNEYYQNAEPKIPENIIV